MEEKRIHLFISYGHEEKNTRIVNELITALKEHFEIWVDKLEILPEKDWRREIVKGISKTDMTVGLLSQYATRFQGVCLDELGISISIPGRKLITVLLEKQEQVNLPSTVTREQWIDLSEWKQYIDTDQWDDYFCPRMDVLIDSIRNPENYSFQGEISTLHRILKPEPFDKRALMYINSQHAVVRSGLIAQVNRWIEKPSTGRFLLITGNAGTGKSHFASFFQHYNPTCVAGAFCEHGKVNTHYVKDLVRYLIYILATKAPDYRYQLLNLFRDNGLISADDTVHEGKCAEFFEEQTAESLFDRLFLIAQIGGFSGNVAIVLDGLDEVSEGGQNPLLDFLCSKQMALMPSYIKWIITSRAEPAVMAKIAGVQPDVIELDRKACDGDIEQYFRERLFSAGKGRACSDEEIRMLTERCGGMFLYAKLICDSLLQDATVTPDGIAAMPGGIGGLYCSYFDRLFHNEEEYEKVKPYLRVMCAYDIGYLSEAFLMRVVGSNREDMNRFYHALRSFARCVTDDGKNQVSLFHKSLYDWLTDRTLSGKYYIDVDTGRREILKQCERINEQADRNEQFEYLQTTYLYVQRYGHMMGLRLRPEFLYALQLSALDNSDIITFRETAEKIRRLTRMTGNNRLYVLSQLDLAVWYYDVMNEEEKGYTLIEDLYAAHAGLIASDPEVHTSAEINRIYIVNSYKKEYEKAWQWANELIEYIMAHDEAELPLRGVKLAKAYYHRCLIEYRMKKYDTCIDTANDAVEAAKYGYTDPRRLMCLIYVVQGGTYRKLKQYDAAIHVLEKSLEYRLALYNRFSLFVANSYSNLIETLYRKAVECDLPVDRRIYDYLESLKRAITVTVGSKNMRILRYDYYHALIAEHEKDYPKAVVHARKCLQAENGAAMEDLVETANRIIQAYT